MKIKKLFLIIGIVIQFVLIGILYYLQFYNCKIACVDNTQIYLEYKGMKNATERSKQLLAKYYIHLDSLKKEYNLYVDSLRISKSLSIDNVAILEKQEEIEKYTQRLNQIEQLENQKNAEQILKEINDKIKNFGKKNKYKIIIGATSVGNLVYKDETIDITNDVIKYLNEQ
jgi:outer membrane protein